MPGLATREYCSSTQQTHGGCVKACQGVLHSMRIMLLAPSKHMQGGTCNLPTVQSYLATLRASWEGSSWRTTKRQPGGSVSSGHTSCLKQGMQPAIQAAIISYLLNKANLPLRDAGTAIDVAHAAVQER